MTLNKQILLAGVVLLLAAGCSKKSDNQPVAQTPSPTPLSTVTGAPIVPKTTPNPNLVYIQWTLKDLPADKYGEPYSEVGLKLTGFSAQEIDLGKFSNCSLENKANEQAAYDDNQLSQLYCWWAGSGDNLSLKATKATEIGVFRQELGESPSERNLPEKLIKTITLPQGSIVQVLGE